MKTIKILMVISGLVVFAPSPNIQAEDKPSTPPSQKEDKGVQESEKPIEVNGQSRNLSLSMMLSDESDNINFVQDRKTYDSEINQTNY